MQEIRHRTCPKPNGCPSGALALLEGVLNGFTTLQYGMGDYVDALAAALRNGLALSPSVTATEQLNELAAGALSPISGMESSLSNGVCCLLEYITDI
ncbi:MAG: hypothetical protein LBK46_10480 [Oscillospiraceae bacterium]|jgi:hypothetical protein|nr:hypothetical protein [Oscillospiraceae bacterium]